MKVARELGETSLAFLVHQTLSEKNIEDTCAAVAAVMRDQAMPGPANRQYRLLKQEPAIGAAEG